MAGEAPTVTVSIEGMALASISHDRSVMHVNRTLLKEIYIGTMRKPPGAPMNAAEAFAITVYLAMNSTEDL